MPFWIRNLQRRFGDLPLVLGLSLAGLCALFWGVLAESEWGEAIQNKLSRPLQFNVRSGLGQDPYIDRRLRLYAMDDSTARYLDRTELTLVEWGQVLQLLDARHPSSVVVDKLFVAPSDMENAPTFLKAVRGLGYPLISGALLYPKPNSKTFDVQQSRYGMPPALRFLPIEEGYPVGPHPRLAEAFTKIGQFNYKDATNHVRPWIRVGSRHVVPHVSLLTQPKSAWNKGAPAIPLDAQGRTLVNLGNPADWYGRTRALKGLVQRIHNGKAPPPLAKDSIVLFIYLQSPDTDLVSTPFGEVPGGYVLASMINSLLTNQWITKSSYRGAQAALASIGGSVLGLATYGLGFLLGTLGGAVAFTVAGLLAFAYGAVEFPWIFWVGAFTTSALILYLERMRRMERRTRRIRSAIDGRVPPHQLQQLLKAPVSHAPTSRDLSVMFVDIVGFFLAAERKTAEGAFHSLKYFLGELTKIIHRNNGIVDKTLGDGILAYFGYDFGRNCSVGDHANQALACAAEMQKWVVQFNIREARAGRSLYPLRIGINSGEVYLGDMGNKERMDFTLIGHPVNFAQRLEAACEDYQVMVGAATFDRANHQRWSFTPRKVQIKHYENLMEAWELDPFDGATREKEMALDYYRTSLGLARQMPRWDVEPNSGLSLQTREGHLGRVRNFSQSGLAVVMDAFLARGVTVQFELRDRGNLKRSLREHGLAPLLGEVRWGRRLEGGRYLHGFQIKNLSEIQARQMVSLLRDAGVAVKKAG